MTTKKKSSVILMTAILSTSTILSPMAVHAQNPTNEDDFITNQESGQNVDLESIVELPQDLSGEEGQLLQDITLPEHWSWVNAQDILTKDKAEYPVRILVDDESYDYSNVEGYNPEEHYVELSLAVDIKEKTVKEQASLPEVKAIETEIKQATTMNTGDIIINETTFPDEAFRKLIIDRYAGGNEILSQTEINSTVYIIVRDKKIKNMKGIEYFTSLKTLDCAGSGIEVLDVSNNKKLEQLYCNNTPALTTLIVAGADNLKMLNCNYSGLKVLDVSQNKNLQELYCSGNQALTSLNVTGADMLEKLDCWNTGLTGLDISKNQKLTQLNILPKTPLAWLNVGDNSLIGNQGSHINIKLDGNSFNIKDFAKDIDLSKIGNIKNGKIDKDGKVTIDSFSKEFGYEYNCGTTKDGSNVILKVSVKHSLPIDEKNFPDKTFREWIIANVAGADDGILTGDESALIREINFDSFKDSKKITSLQGIEYFSNLARLICNGTGITSLDVSNNRHLTRLYCDNTPLTKLNVGTSILGYWQLPTPTIIATANGDSFNIKDVVKDIDLQKVAIVSNGSIDSDGVISNYDRSQPIQYEYDCGTSYGRPVKLTVNIEFAIDINEANFPDSNFRQYVSDNFDTSNPKDGKLTTSEINQITKISIANRTDITSLKGIEHFTALEELYCESTGITSLDVSSNKKLETLYCNNNNSLATLTVSGADALNELRCSGTGIKSLDVSNNTNLTYLDCGENSLVWLNIGNNTNLVNFYKSNSSIAIKIIGNTFNIKDIFPTLDLQKVDITSNGSLDKDKGIVTVDNASQPVIYTYDCGTSKKGAEILYVSLDLSVEKKNSSITINKDLNKTYDGKRVEKPTVDTTGSSGKVIFTYEVKNGNNWEAYNIAPTNVGTYRVTAHLQEDGFFNSAEGKKEFTISQAVNAWDTELSIKDWTYGEKPNDPAADAKFGDIVFTYSDAEKGIYTDKVPTEAGTWYVKAFVAGTSNYTGLEAVKEFTISQATNVWNTELSITGWVYDEKPNDPTADAKYGDVVFTYSDAEKGIYTDKVPTEAGTWYVKATVAGTSNYTGLEAVKEFTISQAANVWNTELLITGWVYDEKPNDPTADAKYGDVVFTYSDAEKGTYTDKVPTEAGTWYVKAFVAGTSNYTGLEAVKEFTISQATNVWNTELSITGWVYDEKPNNPTADAKYGDVEFTYSDSKNGVYTNVAPTEAGTWYVKATVAGTSNYSSLETVKEFTISQVANAWNTELSITDWTYEEKANDPIADAKFGDVVFTYSDAVKGTYTDKVPTEAGTWYVKATVAGTSNYTGLEVVKEFTISQAVNAWNTELSIADWTYGEKANNPIADAKFGDVVFTYNDAVKGTYTDKVPTEAGTWYVKATVAGTSNYAGLEAVKEFTISQAGNAWDTELSIEGWIYDDKPNDPTADAKYGDVVFTYSDAEKGIYTNKVPMDAGTWFVKAIVEGSDNYGGLESIVSFIIAPKDIEGNKNITVINTSEDKDVVNLIVKDGDKELEEGIDYVVDKKQDGDEVIVTITFVGNYTGTITKVYKVDVPEEIVKDTDVNQLNDNIKTGLFTTICILLIGCMMSITGKKRKNIKK